MAGESDDALRAALVDAGFFAYERFVPMAGGDPEIVAQVTAAERVMLSFGDHDVDQFPNTGLPNVLTLLRRARQSGGKGGSKPEAFRDPAERRLGNGKGHGCHVGVEVVICGVLVWLVGPMVRDARPRILEGQTTAVSQDGEAIGFATGERGEGEG